MKKNTKCAHLRSIDNTQLAQVSGGIHASTELLNACIQLLGVGEPGTFVGVVTATAVSTALS